MDRCTWNRNGPPSMGPSTEFTQQWIPFWRSPIRSLSSKCWVKIFIFSSIEIISIYSTPSGRIISSVLKVVFFDPFKAFLNYWKLINLHTDEQWKRIRTITSPSFSSAKLKKMHSLMSHCVDKLVTHLRHLSAQPGNVNIKKAISGSFGTVT